METETSVFVEFMGDTPAIRLLDFLLTAREFDYTLTDLAKKAGISWSTLHRILPPFIAHQVVTETRQVGRAKLYTLNLRNPVVLKLIETYDTLLLQQLQSVELKAAV